MLIKYLYKNRIKLEIYYISNTKWYKFIKEHVLLLLLLVLLLLASLVDYILTFKLKLSNIKAKYIVLILIMYHTS